MHDFGFKRITFYLEKYQKYLLSAKTVGVWITEHNFFFRQKHTCVLIVFFKVMKASKSNRLLLLFFAIFST